MKKEMNSSLKKELIKDRDKRLKLEEKENEVKAIKRAESRRAKITFLTIVGYLMFLGWEAYLGVYFINSYGILGGIVAIFFFPISTIYLLFFQLLPNGYWEFFIGAVVYLIIMVIFVSRESDERF